MTRYSKAKEMWNRLRLVDLEKSESALLVLKLKKLLYICETVVEVHYLLTKHSGVRPLTYNVVVCNAFLTRS